MEKPRKTIKNATFMVIADFATKGAMGVIAILIARFLGPHLYGQYTTATAVCSIFLMLTGLGFEQEFTRRGSIDSEQANSGLSLCFFTIAWSSLVAFVLLVAFLSISPYSSEIIIITLLLWVALVINRLHYPFRYLGLILRKPEDVAVIQVVGLLLLVSVILYLLVNNATIHSIIYAQIIVSAAILVVWFFWMKLRNIKFVALGYSDFQLFFKNSLPFAASNIIWVAYFNFDAFILSLLRTEAEVGIYGAVFKIIAMAYIIGYSVSNTFTPLLFKSFHLNDEAQQSALAIRLVGAMLLISVFMSGLFFILSPWLLTTVIGDEFADGVVIMQILSVSIFFRLLNFAFAELLTTSGRQMERVRLEWLLLVANIIMNFALIPYYGGVGAAIATLVAEAVLLFSIFKLCLKYKLVL